MPHALFIAFFVLIVAGVIVAIVFGFRQAKKRREMLALWALENGWHYTAGEVSSLERRFPNFSAFQQGDNRYGFNVMRGEVDGRDVHAFDYHFQTYSTDSKGNRTTHHHNFSALIVDSGLRLRQLDLRTEGMFDKMKGAFGFDDIDFESVEFSRAFWVTSPSKRWAYDVLHQGTMEFLLKAPRFTFALEDGPYALVHRGKPFKPHEFDQALDLAMGVLTRIPKDIQANLQA